MAYDPLFMALAQAKSQPSHAFRTAMTALDIPGEALGGVESGLKARNDLYAMKNAPQMAIAQRRAALLENYGKLSDSVGPDRAITLMGPSLESAGIDISKITNGGSPSGTPETPEQLMNDGNYGQKKLTMLKTTQDLQQSGPRTPQAVRSNLLAAGMPPQVIDGWLAANTNPNGQIDNKNYADVIQALNAKNMGARNKLADVQTAKLQMADLPSDSSPTSPTGAAWMVKMAARQGKGLLAKFDSPQAMTLGGVDLARAINRAAPEQSVLNGSSYTDNFNTQFSNLWQKFTADPKSANAPLLRKQMYDMLDELDKTATPIIANHLSNYEDIMGGQGQLPQNWGQIKQREMGETLPDIPFITSPPPTTLTSAENPNTATGIPQPIPKPAKPRTMKQGDFTYVLNDKTGQYE